jgi:hypothetical protein
MCKLPEKETGNVRYSLRCIWLAALDPSVSRIKFLPLPKSNPVLQPTQTYFTDQMFLTPHKENVVICIILLALYLTWPKQVILIFHGDQLLMLTLISRAGSVYSWLVAYVLDDSTVLVVRTTKQAMKDSSLIKLGQKVVRVTGTYRPESAMSRGETEQ